MTLRHAIAVVAMPVVVLGGCGGNDAAGEAAGPSAAAGSPTPAEASSEVSDDQRYPDIVDVEITTAGAQRYDLAVTVSSPYDTPQRYADGWRVLAPDGTELGRHPLMHDHAGEQPFTRTQAGVEIPADVDEVTVEGRDQQYGFGGGTVTVSVPRGGG